MKQMTNHRNACIALAFTVLTLVPLSLAQDHHRHHYSDNENGVVRWKSMEGNITAPGVDNPVAGISTGTLPWTATRGTARVNLITGATSFEVEGLVLNGGNATGTPGPVDQVEGSLICNAGTDTQAILTTSPVALSATGDAEFSGNIGNVPSPCANPLFLVRVGSDLPRANQKWIATAAVRTFGMESGD